VRREQISQACLIVIHAWAQIRTEWVAVHRFALQRSGWLPQDLNSKQPRVCQGDPFRMMYERTAPYLLDAFVHHRERVEARLSAPRALRVPYQLSLFGEWQRSTVPNSEDCETFHRTKRLPYQHLDTLLLQPFPPAVVRSGLPEVPPIRFSA